MEATSSLERCGVTSEPRIALIWHTVSPSCYPPMRRSTSHYMMPSRSATNLYKDEAHSTTELEALTKFPRLPKPQESQGRGTTPQLNWRLPASPRGSQSHKNDQRPSRVPMNPRVTSSSKEWMGKSNRFGGSVDLGQLSQVLEGQGV